VIPVTFRFMDTVSPQYPAALFGRPEHGQSIRGHERSWLQFGLLGGARRHGSGTIARATVFAAFFFLSAGGALRAAEPANPPAPDPANAPAAEMSPGAAVVLGLVEGVTEFLPISSTGHLIIANQLMGFESDRQLTDKSGQPLWYRKPSPKHPAGVPLTLKLAADTYTVIIQVGAIAAVVLLYWRQLMNMLVGVFGRSASGMRLLRNIILAVVPVVVIGYPLHDWVDEHLFSVPTVIVAQVAGAFVMLWAERWRRERIEPASAPRPDPSDLSPAKATGIGVAQCLALFPGTSRSMVTIVGGYLAGLNPVKAAEFSFLIGLPTLGGAALLKAVKTGPAMIEVFGWSSLLLGILVAAVSAATAVKFLVTFLARHGLALFAWYRFAVAAALTLFWLL
jgi:undecaprenyl-diphosphatase